jgi:thiamine kinase-like enzyme/SAM-dependent methyltransferase
MHPIINCPICKIQLNENNICKNCLKNYFKNGYFNFCSSEIKEQKNIEIEKILKRIEIEGYEDGLNKYFNNNKKELERFSIVEGDIAFRCINKKNVRCLVLNSDVGNISENLSNIFEEVYSLEKELSKILFQKKRFQELGKENIVLIKIDSINLPFPNEFFDLIILNGINYEKQNDVIKYFNEIKRLITPNGCFCLGTKSDIIKNSKKNKDSIKEIYSYRYNSCMSILRNTGFIVNSNWNFGSLKRSYFIIDLNDKDQIKWFFKNLKKFFHVNFKIKTIFWFLNKSNILVTHFLIKYFASSFIFYCYKNDISCEFERIIKEKTSAKSILQQIRLGKISFILFNKLGQPGKKISTQRKKDLLNKDIQIIQNPPQKKLSYSQIIVEDWIEGKSINPRNPKEMKLLMMWLIDFQEKTSNEIYDIKKIKNELIILSDQLYEINELKKIPIKSIIIKLEKFFEKCNLKSVTSHGDFAPHNILINNSGNIKVIDWELCKENMNPFKDISKIIFYMFTPNTELNEFKENIMNFSENFSFRISQKILNEYFQVEMNIILILQYFILNHIKTDKNADKIFFSKMLTELLNIEKKLGIDLKNYE